MQGYAAYKEAQNAPMTRIDLVLTLYRKALDNLAKARAALAGHHPEGARTHLANTQLIVLGMAAGLPGHKDKAAHNFLRLYEFVAYQMIQGTLESVDAAEKVLRTLLKGFETVREEAVSLELQCKIPPLDRDRLVSLTV
jgi:flagellin-specific chaperone FliS